MKALGIVRNIDDLGRIVVPKDVRKSQGWNSGQPMEMFVEGDKLVMQAYQRDQEKENLRVKLLFAETEEEKEEARKLAIEFLEK